MIHWHLVLIFLATNACATLVKPETVYVPVAIGQKNAWVESDGVRYTSPNVIPLKNSAEPAHLIVGSPGYESQVVAVSPSFQYRSLWLGPVGLGVDLANGSASQHEDMQLQIDLESRSWVKSAPAFMRQSDYQDASRLRSWGQVVFAGGIVGSLAGQVLIFSSVCYEECDPNAERRLIGGLGLQAVATAALIGGAIAWYKGAKRRSAARSRWVHSLN